MFRPEIRETGSRSFNKSARFVWTVYADDIEIELRLSKSGIMFCWTSQSPV